MIFMEKLIEEGFRKAKKITAVHARTFYFASHFLDRKTRQAAYILYAICRISDDSVDSETGSREKLDIIKNKIESAYGMVALDDPLLLAFRKVVDEYNIPKVFFDELIHGMYMDIEKTRYRKFQELYTYCYRVAGVVGLIMLELFGYKDEMAKKCAVDLGIAMQLTNILRDIKEDFDRGRVYLPSYEMTEYGITPEHLRDAAVDDRFVDFLKFYVRRARRYYSSADEGIRFISNSRARFVVYLMSEIYCAILTEIEKNNYDIFSRRTRVSLLSKLFILMRVVFRKGYL